MAIGEDRKLSVAEARADGDYLAALVELLYQLVDDDLVVGHRASEWLGLAPHIEEDVAFSSIAQDEVGHATLYLTLAAELVESTPDVLAFGRGPEAFRNAVVLERPNGPGQYLADPHFDWAQAVIHHYLYDAFETVRLEALAGCSYAPLAQAAAKIRREERYHLLHGTTWLRRVGDRADAEAQARMGAAVRRIWPEIGGLFSLGPKAVAFAECGLLRLDSSALRARWAEQVEPVLVAAGLPWLGEPEAGAPDGRQGQHTDDLPALLSTMAEVFRLDPTAAW